VIDEFGPVGDKTEVIVKNTVKWFKRVSLNLGFHISSLLKLLQVLEYLHCLNVSSVARVLEMRVSISEDRQHVPPNVGCNAHVRTV
jgi:hypothetical protein